MFASTVYDYPVLLKGLLEECSPTVLVGCSSSGEFTDKKLSSSSVCGIALRSSTLGFSVGVGRNLTTNPGAAVKELVSTFRGLTASEYQFRSLLLLTDALAGYTEDILEHLNVQTAGSYQVFGGGAGDDAKFSRTHVFYGGEAVSNAVVALEILSNSPLGIGVSHGWEPASPPMLVTESIGMRLISLNAIPAVEVFQEYAEARGQRFDAANPLPIFLHNVIGIETPTGYKLRVPLSVEADGSINCAAEIPIGCTVRIMGTTSSSAEEAAGRATIDALRQLQDGKPPALALFFDCAATRLRMGAEFGSEIDRVASHLGITQFVGCNTYGQIARLQGQFGSFHNCTAVICIIPE